MHIFTQAELYDDGSAIRLHCRQGSTFRFHAVWLRDNAPDSDTRSADNGQKLITVGEIPQGLKINSIEIDDAGDIQILFSPEHKLVTYSADWLRRHVYDFDHHSEAGWLNPQLETWGSALSDSIPTADFFEISSNPRSLMQWLDKINRYGFATLSGGPIESGALIRIVDLFGYIRETNYGKWFEVQNEVKPTNLAYTGLGLQAHTDNPYRNPVPTLQILYCLENSAQGGESLVIDGFAVCHRLLKESPRSFDLLCRYNARFEYRGSKDVCLHARCPVIDLAADGELRSVRFNNRSAAAITDVPYGDMADYYEALKLFSNIVDDPSMAIRFKLKPGESFIVDNTRILHSRLPFSGTGKRWLQGCYADKDGLVSSLEVLNHKLADQISEITTDNLQ